MSKESVPSSKKLAQSWPHKRYSEYVKQLRENAAKWFANNNCQVHPKMSYCLDSLENWKSNIILDEVYNYISDTRKQKELESKPFPLHKYAHHGLSSQAMVFNLIAPLIVRNDYTPLIQLFKEKEIPVEGHITAEFEYEDRYVFNEDSGQPTSIDVVIKDCHSNPFIFIESKLTETEFGGCSVFFNGNCNGRNPIQNKNECFLHHIGRKYFDLMDKYGFSETLENEKICVFVNYYQFFREVLLAIDKQGTFVLLYDDRSPVFFSGENRGLMPLLIEFVPRQYHSMIKWISIQEVAEAISNSPRHADWIGIFKEKYGL